MSLTHVAMWTEHGLKDITAEQASKLHPKGKVSAHGGFFICKICKQYVTLAAGEKNKKHFRHSSGESDKSCEDRSAYIPYKNNLSLEFVPPIKIQIVDNHAFKLKIGFFLPTDKKINGRFQIELIDDNNSLSYDFSRLNTYSLTYLDVGDKPASYYIINNSFGLFPKKVNGIKEKGALFDSLNCKKIPNDADVKINNTYYLLTKKNIINSYEDIDIELICVQNSWYLYSVTAKKFNSEAARFFIELGYILTEKTVSFQIVWGEYQNTPYVINHKKEEIYVHIEGDSIATDVFPNAPIEQHLCPDNKGIISEISCNKRQQLLSLGRRSVLKYTYLWESPLSDIAKPPVLEVKDIYNRIITEGISDTLPKERIIAILSQFDGHIDIFKDDWLIERIPLKAKTILEIPDIKINTSIEIFQGTDSVWKCSFKATKRLSNSIDEEELLFRLKQAGGKMIPIAQSFGAIALKYDHFPNVKNWIITQIRKGKISENAYKLLRRNG